MARRPTKIEIRSDGYNEDVASRQRTSKRYLGAGSEAGKGKVYCHQSPLHYESVVDSGVCDEEIEIDIKRVVNAEGDGWICETNSWIARLGQPTGKAEDGWFGFSGRSNKNQTFWFRLIGLYYYHKPTDTRERILDVAYDRANLTKQTSRAPVGPNGEELTLDCRVDWADLWTEAGGAEVSLRWFITPTRLKEEVVINQSAQDWITANKPPSTKPEETWMCCAYEVDDSEVPKVRKGLAEVDRESDFDNEDDSIINGATDLDQLLYLLPIEDAYIEGVDHEDQENRANRVKLRTAFMKRSGLRLMVVGAPVLDIKALPDGNLVFDPTIEEQVGSGADDVGSTESQFEPWGDEIWPGIYSGNSDCGTFRFTNVGVPAGATINQALLKMDKIETYATPNNCSVYGEDVDDSAPLNSGHHAYAAFTRATARLTNQNFGALPNGPIQWDVTPIAVEIHGRGGWTENNAVSYAIGDQQTGNGQIRVTSYEDNASLAASYEVDFTSGGVTIEADLALASSAFLAIASEVNRESAMAFAAASNFAISGSEVTREVANLVAADAVLAFSGSEISREAAAVVASSSGLAISDPHSSIEAATVIPSAMTLTFPPITTSLENDVDVAADSALTLSGSDITRESVVSLSSDSVLSLLTSDTVREPVLLLNADKDFAFEMDVNSFPIVLVATVAGQTVAAVTELPGDVEAAVTLAVEQTMIQAADAIFEAGASLSHVAGQSYTGDKVSDHGVSLPVDVVMDCDAAEGVGAAIVLALNAFLATDGEEIAGGMTVLNASSALGFQATDIVREADLQLIAETAVDLVLSSLVDVGLSVDVITLVSVAADKITFEIPIPEGRTFRVSFDNRTFRVQHDDRTFRVKH